MKCYNLVENVTILLLGSIHIYYVYCICISKFINIYSLIGSWVIMVESCRLLMFRGCFLLYLVKSFSFHKIEGLTEGKADTCVFIIPYQYLAS